MTPEIAIAHVISSVALGREEIWDNVFERAKEIVHYRRSNPDYAHSQVTLYGIEEAVARIIAEFAVSEGTPDDAEVEKIFQAARRFENDWRCTQSQADRIGWYEVAAAMAGAARARGRVKRG